MFAKEKVDCIVSNEWFKNTITGIIILNAVLLVLSTYGLNTHWMEIVILIVFTLEAAAKIYGRGWKVYRSKRWDIFDFSIVIAGWSVAIVGLLLPIPQWIAAIVRTIRLVRLGERFESTRTLLNTLGKSMPGIRGAAMLSALVIFIFVLAGTKMFEPHVPFNTMTETWLSLTFGLEDTYGYALESSQRALMLWYLYAFNFTVLLVFVNLFVTVMFDGLQKSQTKDKRPVTQGDFIRLEKQLAEMRGMIENLSKGK